MMYHVSESQLALYSTGDLESMELELVARHLADCTECRERSAEFKNLQGVFSNLQIEPTSDDLRQMRVQTMQAIRTNQRHSGLWRWAPAAAAVVAIVLLFRGNHTPVPENHPVRPKFVAVQRSLQPEAPVHVIPVVRPIHRRPPAGLKSIALLTTADHEPTIKITTFDPNVIILLPSDSSSDERIESND